MKYYAILDVLPNASPDTIKQAYRRKAQAAHPDREGGDAERFKALQEAYDVLSDPERRARYDAGEDATAPAFDAAAALCGLCAQLAGDGDIIARMYSNLDGEKTRARLNATAADADALRFERQAARIKRKTGENFLAAALNARAKDCRTHAAGCRTAERRIEQMIAALSDFTYEASPFLPGMSPVGAYGWIHELPNG